MANATEDKQIQEVEKQEIVEGDAERTRVGRAFVPRVDIYETADELVAVADMPGVDENSVDITLEKNVLTINGVVETQQPDNYTLTYAEYDTGQYERSFTLTNEIDRDGIEAVVKNGVLRLHLPKIGDAKTKKIAVKAI